MNDRVRVLHLEDSARDAELIQAMLESGGVACEFARVERREEFESALHRGGFDIILTDNNLPNYDGASALKAVNAVCPSVPVIVISGSLGEYEAVKCLQYGATDYLLKDRLERLVPAFRRALSEARERQARAAAEAELRANEERMRLALTATNDAIWDWDLATNRMVCNQTFLRLFGACEPSLDPMGWWTGHTHPEDFAAVKARLDAAMAGTSEFWAASHRLRRVDGTWAHVQNRGCLARDAAGRVTRVIGAIQDVTAHVQAENERRQLEEQLRQAQKMEAIGTLAGGIAHDFNNILGIILANVDLAKRDLPEGIPQEPDIMESLDEILAAANRARDLVRQILTFSRRSSSERRTIQAQPIVRECVKLLRTAMPPTVQITERVNPACPMILADPTQVHQVVMNICTNAWHALNDDTGHIEVKLEPTEPTPELLDANPDLDAGLYVCLTITDNGRGMDARTLSRIFEPFYTTKPSGKGTGLGLAVVHGIVKAHGGALRVQSEPGVGTTFQVYFPVSEDTAPVAEAIPAVVQKGAGQSIFIVDDDSTMARSLQRHLKKDGYLARVFHRPEIALEVLRGAPHDCDLVITDFAMPSMNGIEFATRVLQMRPDMPVILISGTMDVEEERQAQLTAFKATLIKPIVPAELSAAVARALASPPATSS